jgi:hypothetical protein
MGQRIFMRALLTSLGSGSIVVAFAAACGGGNEPAMTALGAFTIT